MLLCVNLCSFCIADEKKISIKHKEKIMAQHVLALVNNIAICIKRPQTGLSRLSVMFNNLIKRLLMPLDFGEWYSGILCKVETISFIQNDFVSLCFRRKTTSLYYNSVVYYTFPIIIYASKF